MTIDPIWTVWCDVNPTHWTDVAQGFTRAEAWANARRTGWRRVNGLIVCPRCARNGRA